jgi:hypothetical protein
MLSVCVCVLCAFAARLDQAARWKPKANSPGSIVRSLEIRQPGAFVCALQTRAVHTPS